MSDLAKKVGARLKQAGGMLATAESCTGGGIASEMTSVAGSSSWFDRGFVTYTNEAKREMLGVGDLVLQTHGAVSEETARAMAAGALSRSAAMVSVAVTGIAGPGGGSPAKPVGTVCFAWAVRGGAVSSETCLFTGDREAVRQRSVAHALHGVMLALDSL